MIVLTLANPLINLLKANLCNELFLLTYIKQILKSCGCMREVLKEQLTRGVEDSSGQYKYRIPFHLISRRYSGDAGEYPPDTHSGGYLVWRWKPVHAPCGGEHGDDAAAGPMQFALEPSIMQFPGRMEALFDVISLRKLSLAGSGTLSRAPDWPASILPISSRKLQGFDVSVRGSQFTVSDELGNGWLARRVVLRTELIASGDTQGGKSHYQRAMLLHLLSWCSSPPVRRCCALPCPASARTFEELVADTRADFLSFQLHALLLLPWPVWRISTHPASARSCRA